MARELVFLDSSPHDWDVDEITDPAGPWSDFGFPTSNRAGLQLNFFSLKAESWVGAFSGGYESPPAVDALVAATSDRRHAIVVSRGTGYLVDVFGPEAWSELDCFPITHVVEAPATGLILLADFTSIFAYDSSGLRWRTGRLSWDGVRHLFVREGALEGEAMDVSADNWVPFSVDLMSGRHIGGAAPQGAR